MKCRVWLSIVCVCLLLSVLCGCASFDREYKEDIVVELADREGTLIIREWSFLLGSGAEVYYDYGWRSPILLGQTSGANNGYCPFEAGQYRVTQEEDTVKLSWKATGVGTWRSQTFALPDEAELKRQNTVRLIVAVVLLLALGVGAVLLVRHIRRKKAEQNRNPSGCDEQSRTDKPQGNKRKWFVIAALVHLILLGILFLLIVAGVIIYVLTEPMEFLIAAFLRGFLIMGGLAFCNGLLLFLAVRRVCRYAAHEKKTPGVVALCCSAAATLSYYASVFLMFAINKDWLAPYLMVLALLWLLCTIVGGVMLLVSAKKKPSTSA